MQGCPPAIAGCGTTPITHPQKTSSLVTRPSERELARRSGTRLKAPQIKLTIKRAIAYIKLLLRLCTEFFYGQVQLSDVVNRELFGKSYGYAAMRGFAALGG